MTLQPQKLGAIRDVFSALRNEYQRDGLKNIESTFYSGASWPTVRAIERLLKIAREKRQRAVGGTN